MASHATPVPRQAWSVLIVSTLAFTRAGGHRSVYKQPFAMRMSRLDVITTTATSGRLGGSCSSYSAAGGALYEVCLRAVVAVLLELAVATY